MHVVAVFEVSKESHGNVEAGHDDHASIEHTVETSEVALVPHLILDGKDDTDAFKGVDRSSKVQRKLAPIKIKECHTIFLLSVMALPCCEGLALPSLWQVLEQVEKGQAKASELEKVCQH